VHYRLDTVELIQNLLGLVQSNAGAFQILETQLDPGNFDDSVNVGVLRVDVVYLLGDSFEEGEGLLVVYGTSEVSYRYSRTKLEMTTLNK